MQKLNSVFSIAILILNCCLQAPALAQQTEFRPVSLQVQFHDYAGAPQSLLEDSIRSVEALFTAAHVEIEWLDCSGAVLGGEAPEACWDQVRPTHLYMQLLPEKMARRVPVSKGIYGYSLPAGPGQFAARASLFVERILDLADAHALDAGALMGMVLAHELGHLLLGRDSHSERGLMRCPWTLEDVRDAARGRLRFEPGETQRIWAMALARVEAANDAAD